MTKTSCSSRMVILLLFIISFLHGVTALTSDGLTLLSLLKHWTLVPPLINSSWKASDSNPCSWVGVQCDHTNNLISLNLTSHGIFGQLGPEIGNLYHMETLVLLGNGLSGKVPSELSNCSLLQYLDLEGNRFSGNIPYSFRNLQNLQFMRLSSNMLSGEIPDSLFEIPSLKEVSLHSNLLSGPIPTNIGNLTQLLRLYLYGNQLSGTIPSSLGQCSKLEDIELSFNRLRGKIPVSVWRIPSLVHILVHNNSLSGELPFEMTKLKYLKNISLFDNQFSGVIPQSLGINSSIVKLNFMNNKFSGNIPPNLCFGKHLLELNMAINQLQGRIPSDVGRCATLVRLFLNDNNFTGSLPKFESNLNLKYMDMSKNNISGPIPSSLENCTNLTYINLSRNKFEGLIPSKLGSLVNLVILDLAHNNLQGSLPLWLSNCTKMDRFDVGFNFLNGSLPSSLRSWKNITTLVYLSKKKTTLVFRENHFTGGIPGFLAELSNLRELQLGGNLFGGKIPRSMGNLHNLFYGLNLSANGLTGGIPSEIGRLGLLQSLDISLNNLTGSIDALEGLVSLVEVNISYNLFNGSVPQGLMKILYSSPSSFMGNPLLCVSCLSCIKTSYINPCVRKSTDHKGISNVQIVMIELGSSILISAVLVIIIQRRFHRKKSNTNDLIQLYYIDRGAGMIGVRYAHESNILGEENPTALRNLVLQATENLSDKYIIGRGAHGIVYKARLGQEVYAVKKFEFTRNRIKQRRMMFKEIEVLGMYKHRNLIKYADYWIGEDYGLVLYEFMRNGSLHDILHEKNPLPLLTWNVRLNIAVGIAEGLVYLHNNCHPPIVHRDIKPKNILVDENMEPIISDFGTALYRKLSEVSYNHSETRRRLSKVVVGTPGYIAPENAYAVVQGRKSDVYSYGVVLLDLITRKKVVVPSLNDEANVTSLVSWARSVWLETGKIEYIADSYLASSFPNSTALIKQVTTMFLLALQCTEKDLRKRPIMKDVIRLFKANLFKRCDEKEYVDGLLVKLMGNGKIMAEKVLVVASVNVPKITYVWPSLIFLPSVVGPVVTKPFNWFFLSCWGQYMNLHKSLYYQPKSYIINANKVNALQDLVLQATENLNDRYMIGRSQHCSVYKVILGQQVFALKKFEFGRNKQKQLSIMCNEIEVLGMFKHRNLIAYTDYWIGDHYGIVLYKFMENGSLHDILYKKKPPPPFMWSDRFKIAVGIAQGLEHLHYNCIPPIVHRDIKPKNILLDDNMDPIISEFGTSLLCEQSEDSCSHFETGKIFSSHVICTRGYSAPENAYAVMQSRKSDVYSYGIVLLELITRTKVLVLSLNDETKVTNLVSWARSIWLETGKIEEILDPYLTSSFLNSVSLTKQVTAIFLLALQCTETDPRKRPTMKDVIDLYKNDLRNWRCSEVDYGDLFVADKTLQPYSPCNLFSKVPVVSINHHLHGERYRARIHRNRKVTFNVETKTRDNIDFRFWQDADQFPLGVYDWDDWKLMSRPAVGIDGLVIKLMGNCETEVKTVVVAALIVPKITYSQPCLIYLPSTTGPTLTELFNWFFLSHWGQYMHQQKSLCYEPKSYFINANEIKSLQELVLVATKNLNEQYIIRRGVHGIVYKVILGQKFFTVKKFEFGRNKQKQLSHMFKEIDVLGMYRHRNLIKYTDYWIGEHYGLVLYDFMENGTLYDILYDKTPSPPLTWNVRFKIAVGIAQGLAYLHYDCVPPTVHRDIKPKNILLDANMVPLIADLDTALIRKFSEDSYSHFETREMLLSHIVGTPGYFAPENAYVVAQSRKSDVYSYGVILLELITRKKVFVPSLNDETKVTTLVNWARSVWMETGKIEKIVDSYIANSFSNSSALTKQVTTVFLLALQCTDKDLRNRPTMKEVIGLYNNDLFKCSCDEVEHGVAVAANTLPQPYIPYNLFPDDPVIGIDYHLH